MAYTVGTVTTKIQRRVRDTGYSTSAIMDYMNDVQRDIALEYILRFWEKATPQSYTLDTSTRDITNGAGLPSDLVIPISLINTTTGYKGEIDFVDYKEFEADNPDPDNDTAHTPSYWMFYASTIYLDRKPDQAYTLKLKYQRMPTELTSSSDTPEIPQLCEEVFVYGCGMRIFEDKDMDDKAALFEIKYEKAKQKLVTRYSDRQLNRPIIMGINRKPRYAKGYPY